MKERVYTPINVNLRMMESKALASQIEQELLVPDPIIAPEEEKINENSAGDDARGSNEPDIKGRKKTK